MELELKKWGNSLGLRIPHKLAVSYGFEENSIVEILETESGLVIRKKPILASLQSLLATIPSDFTYPDDLKDFVNGVPSGQELL
jgi:antitoxin MazE